MTDHQLLHQLGPRERAVLERLATEGDSNKEIAKHLGISEATTKVHLRNIQSKIGVHNRTQAALWYLSTKDGKSAAARHHGRVTSQCTVVSVPELQITLSIHAEHGVALAGGNLALSVHRDGTVTGTYVSGAK